MMKKIIYWALIALAFTATLPAQAAGSDIIEKLFIKSGAGAVSLSAPDKLRQRVSVKDFGAKGDGTTDDTAALQAAFNAGAGGRFALLVPKGIYLISATIHGATNTAVFGEGWQSTIKAKPGTNPAPMLKFGSEAAQITVEIHDLELDGNKANNPTGGDCLTIIRGYKANLFNIRATGCHGNGVTYKGVASSFENYVYASSMYANDGYGVSMEGAGLTDTHVNGGDIGYNGLGGVVLAASCSVNQATIWGAGLPNSIGVTVGLSSQVVGNRIEGHGKHGVLVTAGAAFIAGNKIYANSFTAKNTGLYDGVNVQNGVGFGTIAANKIYSSVAGAQPYSMRAAIAFAGAHGQWTIVGNDLPLLAAPSKFTSGQVVLGLLATDKADFNWIRTAVFSRRSAAFNASAASAWTLFPMDLNNTDALAEFSGGTFTPKNTGMYRIEASETFTAASANENIGLALYTAAGAVVRRIDFKRAGGVNSDMVHGVIDEFLVAGTSYELRYFVGSTVTQFLAGGEYTYLKIRAVPN